MLAPDQLAAIKLRREKDYRVRQNEVVSHILFGQAFTDIDALLMEVGRLQAIERVAIILGYKQDIETYIEMAGVD